MYRILSASKDNYITNKVIAKQRCETSNVGQAGTLDLFHLYNESTILGYTGSVEELSRILIQFDYSKLTELTSSILNLNDSSFKAYLQLKNIYGGQTVPSNFTLRAIPLSKSWDEGRGFDVIAFRDLDSSNYISASKNNGTVVSWSSPGASLSGTLGDSNIDIIVSGNIGNGIEDLSVSQFFARGDEDLFLDITKLVSASICGTLQNNGFRIGFVDSEETDQTTRFVKRFASRHTNDKTLHPRIIINYNDTIEDDSGHPEFNVSQSIFVYNSLNGNYQDFISGSTTVTGDNCLVYQLIASKSVSYYTSSFSISHSASITHKTSSISYLTRTYSGSQFSIANIPQSGIYFANVNLNTVEDIELRDYLSGSSNQVFLASWKSLDNTVTFGRQYVNYSLPFGTFSNTYEKNYTVNITNLKQVYNKDEIARLRVFVQNNNTEMVAYKFPTETKSLILKNMKWRLLKAYTKKEVIPFSDPATKLSTDNLGMYFDLYIQDLDVNELYELELMITDTGRDFYIKDKGFIFKVIN